MPNPNRVRPYPSCGLKYRFPKSTLFYTPSTGSSTKLPTGLRSKSDVFRVELRRAPDFEWMSVNQQQFIKISPFFDLLATDEQSTHEKWKIDIKWDGGRYIDVSIYHCQIMIDFI